LRADLDRIHVVVVVVLIDLLWTEEGSVLGCVVFVGLLVFWWRRDFLRLWKKN
jgi:hypothetical protein